MVSLVSLICCLVVVFSLVPRLWLRVSAVGVLPSKPCNGLLSSNVFLMSLPIQRTRLAFYDGFFWGVGSPISTVINGTVVFLPLSTDTTVTYVTRMSSNCTCRRMHRNRWWDAPDLGMWEQSVFVYAEMTTFTEKLLYYDGNLAVYW